MNRVSSSIVRVDPAFADVVREAGSVRWPAASDDPFAALVEAITYQQLAGAAARAIHGRLVGLFDGAMTPAALLATPPELLRGAGLSANKQRSILDLATKSTDGTIPFQDLHELSDEEVTTRLTEVRGIGEWTAQMFLIIQLGRRDVWPVLDLGVRSGWARIHSLAVIPTARELQPLGDPFRPNRSAVAYYCWRSVDTVLPA
jgi:DNA-3-methyladenine glycosylase II